VAPASPAAVNEPIINSPFDEPKYHWRIERGQEPVKLPERRKASYWFRPPERAARGRRARPQGEIFTDDTKGTEYPLDHAELLRARLKDWEARRYEGASRTTKELVALWKDPDRGVNERLFFAQVEAAATVILLVEGPPDLLQGVNIELDQPSEAARAEGAKAFTRYALKMATGSGKTTVMAMLAAWSILNRVHNRNDPRFSDTVLIICPNVTIRDRLRELDPTLGELSLYRSRNLVPRQWMEDLARGDVIVNNWHNLARKEIGEVGGVSARVVKRGEAVTVTRNRTIEGEKVEVAETKYYESDAKWIERLLKDRRGHSPSILVFNDEAHHAYRRGDKEDEDTGDEDSDIVAKNQREATVWIEGQDRLHKHLGGRRGGIALCVDLSATPFYIQGSGNEVGKPFPWIVSDFGLLEAIESGLVKIPQLPTQDASGAATAQYFNIWRWVEDRMEADRVSGGMTPEAVLRYAASPIIQLAQDYERVLQDWQQRDTSEKVPPVFIIVCRDTRLARVLYEWLAEGKTDVAGNPPSCFRNKPGEEMTIRIDSRVSEDIEGGGSKDETRRLRFVLDTVGRTRWPGGKVPEEYAELVRKNNAKALEEDSEITWLDESIPPGRSIRCIISVAMLAEGWDAKTVTHVIGLRPFGSQLLCEQVVGRALRRTDYTPVDLDGERRNFFREETAQVMGVPFELIPFKKGEGPEPPPPPPPTHIHAVPEKAEFEIRFPVVEGFQPKGAPGLSVDRSRVVDLVLDPMTVPDDVLLRGLSSPHGSLVAYGPGQARRLTLDEWRRSIRLQAVAFDLARALTAKLIERHKGLAAPHVLFPALLPETTWFLEKKVVPKGGRQSLDVAIDPYRGQALDRLLEAAMPVEEADGVDVPIIPRGAAGLRSTATVDFYTRRDVRPAQKCHLNALVIDSKWEAAAAYCLETHKSVMAWVKNDHLGFVIPYRWNEQHHRYFPDFIVSLADGRKLIVEVKGERDQQDKAKEQAAQRWARAVTRLGTYGEWLFVRIDDPPELASWLDHNVREPERVREA
jgi:type III restriction enzyme